MTLLLQTGYILFGLSKKGKSFLSSKYLGTATLLTKDSSIKQEKRKSREGDAKDASTEFEYRREHLEMPKVLIGIFMSPFDVHFNRAPLSGQIRFIRHYPAVTRNLHMGAMHLRTFLRLPPFFRNSPHIVQNERTVTKIDGVFKEQMLACYVIQIAGGSVSGIDSYVREGG